MNMGTCDGRVIKMEYTIWLSALIALVTLATPAHSEPRVVCYYTNWSVYRSGTARFNPQNINPYLCTHLVYAFGGFTKDNTLKPFDKYQDIEKGGYAKFTGLKTYNKNLKTLLAIGGWNEGSARFSPMVAAKSSRKEFVKNAIRFLRQNRFDGLDLDWEYPAFRDGGKPKDRENYAKLVKELREEFEKEAAKTGKTRLLLTMAVPAGIEYIQKGFDVKTLNRYLDWMNLLTYDYHSAFEPAVNHHAPLYPLEEPSEYSVDNELNIDYTIKFYLENGADRDKLVVGIPTYGRSYTLFNPDATEIGSPADGPGEQGEATKEKGYLAYYEICEALKPKSRKRRAVESEEEEDEESEEESEEEEEEKPWTVIHPNPKAMGPVAYRGNQWVGYDDVDIVRKKAEYVAQNGLGGIMFWSIDNDDFRGACHDKPYPLIEAAKESYMKGLETTKFVATDEVVSTDSDRRRKNRPRGSTTTTTTTTTTVTTPKPAKSNKRKNAASTTPSWNAQTPEPPTTPDPGSDFKCKDEGFFQHPRDCKKYFWCLDSGPSNLGIVAHQFTCPSGLYFNKAADSCDFARNVLCKVQPATTKAPKTTKATTTTTASTTTTTTTRAPVRVSTRNSILFRTTTTTTPEPVVEEEEEEIVEDSSDDDAEDPKVIKELIDLIKKVGGVEQLEKQLLLSESSSSTNGAISTTPTTFNKKLYQKVLDRAIGKTKYTSKTTIETAIQQNSRGGPQNAGIEATADRDRLIRKERPEYVTINRARSSTKTEEPEESEEAEESEEEEVAQISRSKISFGSESASVASTAKPLQYVNIRRAKPTTAEVTEEATVEAEESSRSRNALFERSEAFVAVDNLNTIDITNTKRDNIPEYVTIRRNRPSYAETTTTGYSSSELDTSKETELEREISSQVSQPQYTNIVRTRSTTLLPEVQPQTPEPTTVLSVQISSLLNEPSVDEEPTPQPQTTQTPEIEKPQPDITTTIPTTTPTTTTTSSPSSTRRSLLRRRGSTSPTTTTSTTEAAESTSQVTRERRPFLRRSKPTRASETSTEPIEITTRNLNRGANRFKNRTGQKESTTVRTERTTRTYARRRLGASTATATNASTSTAASSSASSSTAPASLTSRRTLFNRRRPGATTLSPTTTEPLPNEPTIKTTTMSPNAFIESEELLQDIGEIDYLDDSTQVTTDLPRTTEQAQRRRPLVQLQIKTEDQNLAATTEEEKKRQSKKYSSSFKQDDLNEIIRQRTSGEVVEILKEGKANTESYSSETSAAVALAAHQLIAAPVPVTTDYEEDTKTTSEPLKYTTAYTITQQSEDMLKTPAYTTARKYYDPTSNTYSSVEVDRKSASTYSTDNTNTRTQQRYTTNGEFTGDVSKLQDEVIFPSTVPTYETDTTTTKTSRKLPTRRYRGRFSTTTTDSDVISTVQPSTYEPVTDKRGQIKFNGEYVDSYAGFGGFGASKVTGEQGSRKYVSEVNRGAGSRYTINADGPVNTDSTYEGRITDIRGPEKYKSSVSTSETNVDLQSNADVQSNLGVQAIDERGSAKHSAGKYQGSATYESNVDIQSNAGVQTLVDRQSAGKYSTRVNRIRINADAPVTTDSTYEAVTTDLRGQIKYSTGEQQGSVSIFATNIDVQSNAGAQSNANVLYNVGAHTNTGERYNIDALSQVNVDYNASAQSKAGVQSVTDTEIKTTDIRGSEKYSNGKYEGSVSTSVSNIAVQSNAEAQSNIGEHINSEALSHTNIQYNAGAQSNSAAQTISSVEMKTNDVRGSEKYSTGKYQGSVSTSEINAQSNARAQSNTNSKFNVGAQSREGERYNTHDHSHVNREHNASTQFKSGEQSVISKETNTNDNRGSEKYSTAKYQSSDSISETNVEIQFNGGAQSNTNAQSNEDAQSNKGERYNTDAQSNINAEYNAIMQVRAYNAGAQSNSASQKISSVAIKTTDVRGSEKYSTGKYPGSLSTSETNVQSNAGAQSNTNSKFNVGAQSSPGEQSVTSKETNTNDNRGSEKYSTAKYQSSDSISETNVEIQFNGGAQSNTNAQFNEVAQSNKGERYNTDAQSNINAEYNASLKSDAGEQLVTSKVTNTNDIRGSEKYEGSLSTSVSNIAVQSNAQSNIGEHINLEALSHTDILYNAGAQSNSAAQTISSVEMKTSDVRGSEKYSTGKYQGSISTSETNAQSNARPQFNTNSKFNVGAQSSSGERYNTHEQSHVNREHNASTQFKAGEQSVTSKVTNTNDNRGSEKYLTAKYQSSDSISETNVEKQYNGGAQSNTNAQFNEGAQFNTGEQYNTDAQSNINAEYNASFKSEAGEQLVTSKVTNTNDIRGSEKYSTANYQASDSIYETNVDVHSNVGAQSTTNLQHSGGAQSNTGEGYKTDAQSNVNIEYNASAKSEAGEQLLTSTKIKTADIRGSEKYSAAKYQGSVSSSETNVNMQSNPEVRSNAKVKLNVGIKSNTDQFLKKDTKSNTKIEYNESALSKAGVQTTTEIKTNDLRGSEENSALKYQSSVSTSEINVDVQNNYGAQSNANVQYNVGEQSNNGKSYITATSANSKSDEESVISTEIKASDISGSEKYSTAKYQGSVSISETNVDTQSNVGAQYNASIQTNVAAQSNVGEGVNTDALHTNVNIDYKVGSQYNAGVSSAEMETIEVHDSEKYSTEKYKDSVTAFEANVETQSNAEILSVTSTKLKISDSRGSDKYSTAKYQSSVSSVESNVGLQSDAGVQTLNERGSGKYSIGVNQISAETPVTTTDVIYEARTTDIRGPEKYKNSISTFETNVDVLSNVQVQRENDERGTENYSTGVNRFGINTQIPATTDATYESKITSTHGSGTHKTFGSTFKTNVDVQSNVDTQSVTKGQGSGERFKGVKRFRVTTEAPVAKTDATYEARTTDIRGTEKYKDSVPTLETNIDVQSTSGFNSNVQVQSANYERGTETYLTGINRFRISTDAQATTDATNEAIAVDIRGSESSSSTFKTNVDVESNIDTQSVTYGQGTGKRYKEIKRFRITTEIPLVKTTDAMYEARTTEIRGSEKYIDSVSTLETNLQSKSSIQSNVQLQRVDNERGSENYSTRVNRTRISAETPATTTKATYEAKITDVHDSETYISSGSSLKTNENLQSNLGTQSVTDEQGSRKRVKGVKRFRVTTEAPVITTDATYDTKTTNATYIGGSAKYSAEEQKKSISTFETNEHIQSDVNVLYNASVQSVTSTEPQAYGIKTTDIRGSNKYSTGKYQGLVSSLETKYADAQTKADVQYNVDVQSNTGGLVNLDALSNINIQYSAGAQSNSDIKSISSADVKTTNMDDSNKYSTKKYQGLISDFESIQSNAGVQSNAQYNLGAQSEAAVHLLTTSETSDVRGSEKYFTEKEHGSVSTNIDVQSNAGSHYNTNTKSSIVEQSNITHEGINTNALSNVNIEYNANSQSKAGAQSEISTETKTTDVRALQENSATKYLGSVSSLEANIDSESNASAQSNGVQSVTSTEVKTTDIRGINKYSSGKYQGSLSTLEANVDVQSNRVQSIISRPVIAVSDIRGPIKYGTGESESSVSSFETNVDLQTNKNAHAYSNVQYDSSVQTNTNNANAQSNDNAQFNTNAQSTYNAQNAVGQTDTQSNINVEYNAGVESNTNAQFNAGGQYSTDAQFIANTQYNADAQLNSEAQYNADTHSNINTQYVAQSNTGEVKSVTSTIPEITVANLQGLEKNSSIKYQSSISTFETNVDVHANAGAQYNASVQSQENNQSYSNGQFVSSTAPLSYEFNATEIRGPAKYSSGTIKETATSLQGNVNGQTVSSARPTTYKIRTKVRRPTKFSGGYRSRGSNVASKTDAISTLQPTTYETETTDNGGETKYSTGEYRDDVSRFESNVESISTVQPTISTFDFKTRGSGNYLNGQYRSRTSSSLQTDRDGISAVQPTTYEADTTDIRGSSRYSSSEYTGRVSEVETNTDIPFVTTIQSYQSEITDARGPTRYSTVGSYVDGTYNENTDRDVISNHISTTYAPEIINTRVPTRFTTAKGYRGSTIQTDTEIPSTVSTITEYSFDSTVGKTASKTSRTGYRGRVSSESEVSESTSGRTDIRQPTRLITGSYAGRGTRPTIASESTENSAFSGSFSDSTQERGAAKYYVTSDVTDIRDPSQFSSSLDLRGSARFTGSETLTARTVRPGFLPQNTIDPILSGITINIGAEKGESTARYNSATDGSATTLSASRKTSQSIGTNVVNSGDEISVNIGESTATTANPSTIKSSRPTGFTPSLLNLGEISEEKSSIKYQINQNSKTYQANDKDQATATYDENEKIPVPVIYAYSSSGSSSSQSSSGSSSQEPSFFTREYLLESPVTKTYEEEYQYLSPVTIPSSTDRKSIRRKIYRKYNAQTPAVTAATTSTTTTTESPSPATEASTLKKRRTTTVKPFQKLTVRRVPLQSVQKITLSKKEIEEAKQRIKPSKDYDYYDDNHEKIAKYDGTKVILRGEGNIQCLDIGNFPHPTSCKKFISCARIESGAVLGWEYICPKGLSFDPVGGICNWSAGLGCNEKDV